MKNNQVESELNAASFKTEPLFMTRIDFMIV